MATILVVDSLPANRRLLVSLLRADGHHVIEAVDGCEGLAAVLQHQPDLIIADVFMPVMDGAELVRQLRLNPGTDGTPVIFSTTHAGEREARALARSSGVSDVVTTPAESDVTLAIVRRALAPPLDADGRGDLRNANVRLHRMIDIGLEFASEPDVDRLLELACLAARDLFGAAHATIGILAPDDRTIDRIVASEPDAPGWIRTGEPLSGGLARVVRERRPLRGEVPAATPSLAFLAAPVASPAHVYGWICVVGHPGRTFTADDEALATSLAEYTGRVYENRRLYTVARTRTEELEYEMSERTQAERALLEAGALQRAIFNSANFSSIATDANGVIQIFNVGAERMLGYAAAEVLNTITPADISDPDEVIARAAALSVEFGVPIAPGFEALVFKASRRIEDIYELTYFRKDGSRFPAVVSVTALRDANNAIIGYLLIGTDNTARKQAEEALLKAGALQRAIFNSANFSSIATDANGVIQIFNVGAERMLGYSAVEVMNQITPADISDPQEVIARAAALSVEFSQPIAPGFEALVFKASRGIEDIYELTYFRKDGSRFPAVVSVTALRDAYEAIIGYLLIGTDNTARRKVEEEWQRAEAARRTSDERYRSLFECAPDGIVIADSGGHYLDVNGSICRMLGYSRDELIGRHASDVVIETQVPIPAGTPALGPAAQHQRAFQFKRKNGTTFEAEVIATLLPDGHMLEMVRDITEPKRFERALQQKNVELEGASRMKSEFLANMSHELRTPLNAIIGFSEVLKDGLLGELTDRQRRFIGDIFSSGVHLLSLINDILDLSKVEAGKMTLDLEPVAITSFLTSCLSIVKEKATTRGIRIRLEAADDLDSMQADVRKVRQIVYNLLANAVKFTPDGGTVTLRAERIPRLGVGRLSTGWAGRIVSAADSELAEFLELSVTDTGIGISPQGLQQLFTPFSQVDSGLSRQFEGTGLGLVMVKLLSDLHGGTVAAESSTGEGSRFTVWLPFRQPEQTRVVLPPIATPPVEHQPAVRIALVVEDDFKSAELIRMLLEAEGFTVLPAPSAEAALVLVEQQPISLITLDMLLPDMDGWDFLSRVKRLPALRGIPVVIISIVADRHKGFALGAAAVLEKPLGKEQLYRALTALDLLPLSQGSDADAAAR